ncbi:hypothetical protein [Ensifer adhaerens]|jgi:hypothetical protein|uniref:hypothetical protein n=1 Tax=Rhizobium sp. 11_C7_N12_5 TaxID=3240770 RepID=UPI0013AF9593|nr:hypothetical protein [Ensifer adhaerens]
MLRHVAKYLSFVMAMSTSKTVSVEFTKGILTSYSAKNSSEFVGILAIPSVVLTTATLIEKVASPSVVAARFARSF